MTNICNKNGKCLCGSFYQTGHSRGKYSDLEHISTETFKSEKDKRDWKRLAYWRRMGHYKRCNIQIKGILWKERKKKRQKYLAPQFKALNPAFLGAYSFHSLIFIQYPHVFVCEEVQKRNVANGLVNITHCNFFGNPGPKKKNVNSLKYLN